jgi:hypothetical protein
MAVQLTFISIIEAITMLFRLNKQRVRTMRSIAKRKEMVMYCNSSFNTTTMMMVNRKWILSRNTTRTNMRTGCNPTNYPI